MTIDLELIAPADPPTYLLAYDTDCDLMTDYACNTASTIIQSSFDGASMEFVRKSNIPLHEAVRFVMEEVRIRFLADTVI